MFLITSVQNTPQPIHSTSTTQNLPLGTIVQAADGIQGVGEFIYLQGVASTVVGSLVTYDHTFAHYVGPGNGQRSRTEGVGDVGLNVASQVRLVSDRRHCTGRQQRNGSSR
jgi:hypothetical protein